MHNTLRHHPRAHHRRIDAGNRQWSRNAEAADGGVDVGELERGDHQTMTEGEGGPIQLPPVAAMRHQPGAFAGQPQPRRFAKAESFIGIDQMLHRHGEREMGHAGIAGFLQDPGQAQLRIIAHIANTMAIEDERMGIHHAVWLDNPLL